MGSATTIYLSAKNSSHPLAAAPRRWVTPAATTCTSSLPRRNGTMRRGWITLERGTIQVYKEDSQAWIRPTIRRDLTQQIRSLGMLIVTSTIIPWYLSIAMAKVLAPSSRSSRICFCGICGRPTKTFKKRRISNASISSSMPMPMGAPPSCSAHLAAVDRRITELFLDSQKLIVLRHAIGATYRTALDLAGVGGYVDVRDRRIFGLSRAMTDHCCVLILFCKLDAVERLGERADLIDFDQNGVRDPPIDGFAQELDVRDQEIVTDQLHLTAHGVS